MTEKDYIEKVIFASRGIMMLWHGGLCEKLNEREQNAFLELDAALGEFRDFVCTQQEEKGMSNGN